MNIQAVISRFTPTHVGTTTPAGTVPWDRSGLPPRTWGRLRPVEYAVLALRFTPTHVGTTITGRRWKPSRAVYPHARGDDVALPFGLPGPAGLPPRTWGRRTARHSRVQDGRFTPTHVGTTGGCWPRTCPATVYPHARGDDVAGWVAISTGDGLPPRTWGRLAGHHAGGGGDRFTPTHVGTTPRVTTTEDWLPGLPPRTWGRRTGDRLERHAARFTPTHVGTTRAARRPRWSPTVYPHARGDDAHSAKSPLADRGLPPRTWGRLRLLVQVDPFKPVYPHARGDDVMIRGSPCD